MIQVSANGGAQTLISAFGHFVNLIICGNVPVPIRPFFFGANLTALAKKGSGVHPIAVGSGVRPIAVAIGRTPL